MNAVEFEALCPHRRLVVWRATGGGGVTAHSEPRCPAWHDGRARLIDLIWGYQ